MKKITFSAIALTIVLAFTACRNEKTEESLETAPEAAIEEQDLIIEEVPVVEEDTLQVNEGSTIDSLEVVEEKTEL